jgi:hypothetical protein
MERPAIFSPLQIGIHRIGLFQAIWVQSHDAMQLGIVSLQSLEIHLGQLATGKQSLAKTDRKFADTPKGDRLEILFLG